MAFAENLAVFINADTPGFAIAKIHGVDVEGLMNQGYSAPGIGFSDMESVLPEFICKEVGLPEVEHDTELWISEQRYVVADIQPDGHGLTTLQLKK